MNETGVLSGIPAAEIEKMLDSGEADFKDGQLVRAGDLEGTAILGDVDTQTVYDVRDGSATVLRLYSGNNTLIKQLSKRDQNPESDHYGKRIFTLTKPTGITPVPKSPCYFNKEHPQFADFRAIGITTICPAWLPTTQEVDFHSQNKHPRELAAVQKAEADARERRNDERAQQTLEAMNAAIQSMSKRKD